MDMHGKAYHFTAGEERKSETLGGQMLGRKKRGKLPHSTLLAFFFFSLRKIGEGVSAFGITENKTFSLDQRISIDSVSMRA